MTYAICAVCGHLRAEHRPDAAICFGDEECACPRYLPPSLGATRYE